MNTPWGNPDRNPHIWRKNEFRFLRNTWHKSYALVFPVHSIDIRFLCGMWVPQWTFSGWRLRWKMSSSWSSFRVAGFWIDFSMGIAHSRWFNKSISWVCPTNYRYFEWQPAANQLTILIEILDTSVIAGNVTKISPGMRLECMMMHWFAWLGDQ